MGFGGALSPFGPFGGLGGGVIPPPPIPPPPPNVTETAPPPAAGVVYVVPTDHSTQQVPPYSQRSVLSQVTYALGLRWNARANVWTMGVKAANGTLLADSIPIRNGLPVGFWASTVAGYPPGNFFAIPVDHNPDDAGQDQLGGRVLLTYFDPA
jgi:hypothetical protein